MRPLALALFWLLPGLGYAQQDSLAACMDRLATDSRFATLARKLEVGAMTGASPAMLADASFAGSRERQALSEWAEARGACIGEEGKRGNAAYRPPLQTYSIEAENKVMAAAVALYNREISFGDFNRQRLLIAEQLRAQKADLSRQIQAQRTALEQSDRQSREREQMQRDIEAAELQASAARRQAELAQEALARLPNTASRKDGPRRYVSTPAAPYRNCFRFGARITCTGW
jgi:hypothetical protein